MTQGPALHTVQAGRMESVTHRLIHLTRWLRYQIDPKNGLIAGEPPATNGRAKRASKSGAGSRR